MRIIDRKGRATRAAMRPRLLFPLAVVALFAAALPVPLSSRTGFPSNEDCLTLADSPPSRNPHPLALLERCSVAYPTDVELLGDLADAYEAADAGAQARKAYERAVGIDPDYADLRVRFARFLLGQGDAGAAASQAEAALKIQPNRLTILNLLHDAQAALRAAE
jgi:tetratricopeptide (TPR) repeat protein